MGATSSRHSKTDSLEPLKGELKGPSTVCVLRVPAPKSCIATGLWFSSGDEVSKLIFGVVMFFLCHLHPRKDQSLVILDHMEIAHLRASNIEILGRAEISRFLGGLSALQLQSQGSPFWHGWTIRHDWFCMEGYQCYTPLVFGLTLSRNTCANMHSTWKSELAYTCRQFNGTIWLDQGQLGDWIA